MDANANTHQMSQPSAHSITKLYKKESTNELTSLGWTCVGLTQNCDEWREQRVLIPAADEVRLRMIMVIRVSVKTSQKTQSDDI